MNSINFLKLAIQHHVRGDLISARNYYQEALKQDSNSALALGWLGAIEAQLKNFKIAQPLLEKAISLQTNNPDFLVNYANLLQNIMEYEKAIKIYEKSLRLKSDWVCFSNLAACYNELKKPQRGLMYAEKALLKQENYPEAWNNRGVALNDLKRNDEALASYDRSIELKPDYAEAWCNRGVALIYLKRHEEALASCNRSIELKPDYAEAWNNRGNALNDLKRHEEALASCNRSIELKSDYAEAWVNRGVTFNDLGRREEALASYEQSIKLKSDIDFLLGSLIHTQMKICDWTDLDSRLDLLQNGIKEGRKCSVPFTVLGLLDNPDLQLRVSEIYTKEKCEPSNHLGPISKHAKKSKIRIGYYSMDFHEHPVTQLTADLFELHDRNQFEVFAFSFGKNNEDPVRRRLEKSFDKFIDVYDLSSLEIARLSRELYIDIAIDLGGHTKDSRPQIFSERAAPIQVNYLGFPGTWGHSCMDYFIGDKITITNANREFFSEKIVYMPDQFQVNPSSRPTCKKQRTRTEFGLPDNAIVFCCFNNNWKITPIIFESWMRILRRLPRSVLWLYAENPWATKNLVKRASECGVSSERLIFSKRISLEEYIVQYRHADLFLDTVPYNAGTTASDALWAGLPVLTCAGESFASRMAASLSETVGLPELFTRSLDQYEALAIEIASNPERLKMLKDRLMQKLSPTSLFDTSRFTRHLESAYKTMYERCHADLPPDDIYIST